MKWFIIGLLACFTPIWRGAGHPRTDGVTALQLFRDSTRTSKTSEFGHPHILYEEAVARAQEAWRAV